MSGFVVPTPRGKKGARREFDDVALLNRISNKVAREMTRASVL